MTTNKEKIFIIYIRLLDCVEDNQKVLNVCPCLIEVLEEVSSSDDMNQFVSDINSKSSNVAMSLHDMLHSSTDEQLTSLFNFVQLF